MTRLESGSASLVGSVRVANEDSVLVADGLVAVADGMGGHLGGEVASADAVDVLAAVAGSRSLEELVHAVHVANRRINDRAAEEDSLRGMGTTVCAVGLVDADGDHLAVLNVGDSRVYLFADGELRRLTEDHSLVETLVREGRITPEEAESHPQRNVLTRALGVEPLVVVDAWLLSPRDGDRLLLCSDGLFNELSEERIAEILAEGDSAAITSGRLAAEADAAGGRDNISTVVADVFDSGREAAPAGDRVRRIATPTVDLDDTFDDPATRTATVPMVPVAPPPVRDDQLAPDAATYIPEDLADGELAAEETAGSDATSADADPGAGRATEDDPDGDTPSAPTGVDEADHAEGQTGDPSTEISSGTGTPTRSRLTWRTPVFILAVLVLLAFALAVPLWNAAQGWFVRSDGDTEVVLYRGRPDGFLWVSPTPVERDELDTENLPTRYRDDVTEGKTFDNEDEARRYLDNLRSAATTTTTSTTTTTAPPTTAPPATTPSTAPATAPPPAPPAPPVPPS